jgi:tetratricopeptide (TPR) repeat protein
MNRVPFTGASWCAAASAALFLIGACSGSRAPRETSDEIVGRNNRGVGLMGQFNFDAARDVFASLADAHPDRRELQVNLAIATLNRQQDGDSDKARAILERVSAAEPGNLRARYNLGLILLNDGRAADALPQFAFVAEHAPAPGDAFAVYYIARCRFQLGDFPGALTEFRRALQLDQNLRSALYGESQALQRLGRTAEAQQRLNEFQEMASDPRSEVVEFKYTRMGQLAEAVTIDQPLPQPIPRPSGPVFESTPVTVGPAGITWRRFDAAHPASITTADIDGDGQLDIFIAAAIDDHGATKNAVLLNRGAAGFELDSAHPLASVTNVAAALWGDVDNDGLLDVYLCRDGANQLWRQTAKGQWADVTATAHADGGGGSTIDGAMFDADHDGDLDLLLIKRNGADELLNNNGDGTFRPIGAKIGLTDSLASSTVLVADLDADRDADIVVVKKAAPPTVLMNERTWQYHRERGLGASGPPMVTAVAGDLDADGRVEIYASGDQGITRWKRASSGEWSSTLVGGSAGLAGSTQLALADVDGHGGLDLIGTGSDGGLLALTMTADGGAALLYSSKDTAIAGWTVAVLDATRGPSLVAMPAGGGGPLLWRPGDGRFPFVTIALSGRDPHSAQLRSNVSGIGTQVAARADSHWSVRSTYRTQSGPGQSLQPLAIGTGGRSQIDFVALTWSDGVFQSELALAPGLHAIAETERQLSSCPVLFAFDGRHFAFVTDLLGVGGIGTPTSPGVYDSPRPRENVLLPDGLPQSRHGRYELKITEPMEEAAYVDRVRLVAYDLPPGWSMVLDERKAISAPEATGEPRFYRKERVPAQAVDDEGEDVTRAVTAVDGIAAPPGRVDPRFIGRTADHALTLRFDGALDHRGGAPMLVADGWIEYPYAQTLFAAWQAGADYRAPTIEARGDDGRWHVLRREFGYPAGMPRRMSLPLGRLPRGTKELRIHTTQEIYWDRLAVAYSEANDAVVARDLPLMAARLASEGFPRREMHAWRRPSYDYDHRAPLADMRHLKGRYTATGPITDLLTKEDGAVAIFGPGEELQLEFDASLEPVAPGWTRRFALEARGWCKDMDLYTRDGDTVEPLPGVRGRDANALQQRYTNRDQSGR